MNRWNCDPWDAYLYPSICCVIIAVILLRHDAADVQEMERCGVAVAQLTATASWNTVVGYDRNTTNQIDSLIIHLQIWYRLLGTEDSCAVEFPGIELSWTHCVHVKLKPQGTSKLGAHMQKDHKRNTSCWHTHTKEIDFLLCFCFYESAAFLISCPWSWSEANSWCKENMMKHSSMGSFQFNVVRFCQIWQDARTI